VPLSNARGYEDKSFVRARVSRLARTAWDPDGFAGGGISSEPFADSIWKGKEPRPVDAVDSCDPDDMPKRRLLGGSSGEGCGCRRGVDGSGDWFVKLFCARGDTGGVRIGRSEIGEGGTKGKDSKIESARVEVADTTEDPDTLRWNSKP